MGTITITINHYDDDDNVVDTTTVDMTAKELSLIVDTASEYVIKKDDAGDMDTDLETLKDALMTSGVL
jgi:hypothetical protein